MFNTEKMEILVLKNLFTVGTAKELAQKIHTSPDALRKAFRRQEEIPISKFIVQQRITIMKCWLELTNLRCCEICNKLNMREDTGAKMFKRELGLTMKEYRAMRKERQKEKI